MNVWKCTSKTCENEYIEWNEKSTDDDRQCPVCWASAEKQHTIAKPHDLDSATMMIKVVNALEFPNKKGSS
ncbi:hypothetical protein QGN29_12945 [Temperatibacter marinus]|uniref:Uncharacterized protein n=1 Tax=Temperatibacter marinus TaxID=1456591 RepID=A0AA52HAC4_9PROT|nr:hypothetical protein [Temperatibacter marinus]WND02453.1 hypothetical protein QGN29_12945 [Temperatibacter marinus]